MNDEILSSQPLVDARGRSAVTSVAVDATVEATAAREKFDLHRRAEPLRLDSSPLPWGYGTDRATVLVRSPDSVYVYWEMTDAGIEQARGRLGPAGAHGWFNLRVYDTTGRDFDGTNANHYVDLAVDRAQRDQYLAVNRPGSSIHVEVGVKTHEGYFQPVARSGRGDFPRKSPSPNTSLEWMTVTDGNDHPVAASYHSRYQGPEASAFQAYEHGGPPSQPPPSQDASAHATPEGGGELRVTNVAQTQRSFSWSVSRSSTSEWVTLSPHDLGQVAHLASFFRSWQTQWKTDLRFLRWLGKWPGFPLPHATELLSWHAGPFPTLPFPTLLADGERVLFEEDGVPMVVPSAWGELQIAGPWQVTIRGMQSAPARRVLATWTMHVVRATPVVTERWITSVERVRFDEYAHQEMLQGASEALAWSLGGASEALRLGASERLWQGASEWKLVGASETLALGASELSLMGLGASALLAAGASEWMMAGGSERRLFGGSEAVSLTLGGSEGLALGSSLAFAIEARASGGSEVVPMGGSEVMPLGGSEHLLGASEVLPRGGRSRG